MKVDSLAGLRTMPSDLDDKAQLFPVSPQVNSPRYDAEDCTASLVGEAL